MGHLFSFSGKTMLSSISMGTKGALAILAADSKVLLSFVGAAAGGVGCFLPYRNPAAMNRTITASGIPRYHDLQKTFCILMYLVVVSPGYTSTYRTSS